MDDRDAASSRTRPVRPPYGRRRAVAATIVAGPIVVLIGLLAQCDDAPTRESSATAVARSAPATSTSVAATTTTAAPPTTTSTTSTTTTSTSTTSTSTSTTSTVPVTSAPTTAGAAHSIDEVGGPWWLVNRDRPLPAGYVPAELVTPDMPVDPDAAFTTLTPEAAAAFAEMAAAAATDGHALQLNSAYRSEVDQAQLYERYARDFGAATAALLVAQPGTSEHQTGLAADIGLVGLPDDQTFGSTAASAWVAANAHRFGLIVRYPPDKAEVTGYANEPWHLRYVGVELAGTLHAASVTMEEHFGVPVG